jgi:Zn-dependent protease
LLSLLNDPVALFTLVAIFVASISLHEFGHAVTADLLGDPTPREAGRVTLNPVSHLDVLGTLMLLSPLGFGWAKPVPVSPHNFKHPRLYNLLVSAAGPLMNLLLAFAALIAIKYVPDLTMGTMNWLRTALGLNLILFVFNLLPIPPLDGGHIIEAVMPRRWLPTFQQLKPWGVMVLLVMVMVPGVWSPVPWLKGLTLNVMEHLI